MRVYKEQSHENLIHDQSNVNTRLATPPPVKHEGEWIKQLDGATKQAKESLNLESDKLSMTWESSSFRNHSRRWERVDHNARNEINSNRIFSSQ